MARTPKPGETPQDPKVRYWAPDAALPLRKTVLDQLGMHRELAGYTLRAKLEAAYLSELQVLADNTTDGRHALVVNMMQQLQQIIAGAQRAEADEALAKTGASNDPFMGRVLAR